MSGGIERWIQVTPIQRMNTKSDARNFFAHDNLRNVWQRKIWIESRLPDDQPGLLSIPSALQQINGLNRGKLLFVSREELAFK